MIRIGKPQLVVKNGETVFSASVEFDSKTPENVLRQKIWFSLPEKYGNYIHTENSNCFMLAMLYHAMRTGHDLHLEGTVSSVLLSRINSDIVKLICSFNKLVRPICVTASSTCEFERADGVGTGFSGGVDSFSTFIRHYFTPDATSRKITDLFFFNVGTHGLGDSAQLLESTEKNSWQDMKYSKAYLKNSIYLSYR